MDAFRSWEPRAHGPRFGPGWSDAFGVPSSGADIHLLWGQDDPPLDRLRVGDYRIPYFVLEKEVRVTEVLHRSEAYRGVD